MNNKIYYNIYNNMLKRIKNISQNSNFKKTPPGQFVTDKFPALTFGKIPTINIEEWELKITGNIKCNLTLKWEDIKKIEMINTSSPFHCITQWSRMKNDWEGIPFKQIYELAKPNSAAIYVMFHSYGGYSTNLELKTLLDKNVILAHAHDGLPLSKEHGYPLRLIVPQRYGWKSAKWINKIEFMNDNVPGFWESRGYHMNGDYWKEERFS